MNAPAKSNCPPLTFGSLFAGIGGFDLGFERAGLQCSWQVEINDYATKVLEKHWPLVRRWRDVRNFPPEPASDWDVDVICGGFPCQDISYVGKGGGLIGEKSGLFYEAARVIRILRPRYVVLENVTALLRRGVDAVLWALAEIGYDAQWHCISAAALGAAHIRDRLFILANDNHIGLQQPRAGDGDCKEGGKLRTGCGYDGWAPLHHRPLLEDQCSATIKRSHWWDAEPGVGRVAHGVPARMDRIKCLGNAIVPQVAEFIGRRLMQWLQQ